MGLMIDYLNQNLILTMWGPDGSEPIIDVTFPLARGEAPVGAWNLKPVWAWGNPVHVSDSTLADLYRFAEAVGIDTFGLEDALGVEAPGEEED